MFVGYGKGPRLIPFGGWAPPYPPNIGQPPQGGQTPGQAPRGPEPANPGKTPRGPGTPAQPPRGPYGNNGDHVHTNLSYERLCKEKEKPYKLFKNKGHYAHHLSELVEEACKNLGTKKMTTPQATGLNKLKASMRKDGPKDGSSFLKNSGYELGEKWSPADEVVIQNFYKKFDVIFFFGTLAGRCTWEIDWETLPGVLGYCHTAEQYGYNTQMKGPSAHQRSVIKLQKNLNTSRDKRLSSYLSTLLHEMCHSFMMVWSCDARSCYANDELLGTTGHGDAWQNTCTAVDKAVRKQFGLKFDMGRTVSYAHELAETGAQPSKIMWFWEIDPNELARSIEYFKKEKAMGRGPLGKR